MLWAKPISLSNVCLFMKLTMCVSIAVSKILDSCLDKYRRKVTKIFPSKDSSAHSLWRRTRASNPGPPTYEPSRPPLNSKVDFAKAAMNEQRELWKAKERTQIQTFSNLYCRLTLNLKLTLPKSRSFY